MNDADKVITLWLMVYDQDPTQAYLLTCKEKVFACVEGVVRSVAPDELADQFVAMTLDSIDKAWDAPFIPMRFQGTKLFIHRLEIDKHNPIHQTLMLCRRVLKESWMSGDKRYDAVKAIDELLQCPVSW